MAQKDSDLKKIETLIQVMKENDLVEIEIQHGDDKILLKRFQPNQPVINSIPMTSPNLQVTNTGQAMGVSAGPEAAQPQPDDGLVDIESPLVGTFYATPSPDSAPHVEKGSRIEPHTVVCIIEAMKVMNEIKAQISGTIVEILVTSGQAVEYGQVLFKVKPD